MTKVNSWPQLQEDSSVPPWFAAPSQLISVLRPTQAERLHCLIPFTFCTFICTLLTPSRLVPALSVQSSLLTTVGSTHFFVARIRYAWSLPSVQPCTLSYGPLRSLRTGFTRVAQDPVGLTLVPSAPFASGGPRPQPRPLPAPFQRAGPGPRAHWPLGRLVPAGAVIAASRCQSRSERRWRGARPG